jgi:hypothetical protein
MKSKDEELLAIGKKHLGFETLSTRKSDGFDFREVAVWSVRAALEAAFAAGQRAAGQAEPIDIDAEIEALHQAFLIAQEAWYGGRGTGEASEAARKAWRAAIDRANNVGRS